MLDTNMASYVIKGYPLEVRELLYGLALKGDSKALSKLIHEFLLRVKILSWDTSAASVYGQLRASCTLAGVALGALDMLIAPHAVATHSTLVTRDKAFIN